MNEELNRKKEIHEEEEKRKQERGKIATEQVHSISFTTDFDNIHVQHFTFNSFDSAVVYWLK